MYYETVEQWDAEVKRQLGVNHRVRAMQKAMERGDYYTASTQAGDIALVNELIEAGVLTPAGDKRRLG